MTDGVGAIRIAFCGRMRHGKTTAANYLIDHQGFTRVSFATPIKDAAKRLGWNGKKDDKGRTFLQHLGDVIREYDEIFLIDEMVKHARSTTLVVCDDARLIIEADTLRNAGWTIVKIVRESEPLTTAGHHATEDQVDKIQAHIELKNDGTLEELYAQLDAIIGNLRAQDEATR
jgi:dephospho-CoA kinase